MVNPFFPQAARPARVEVARRHLRLVLRTRRRTPALAGEARAEHSFQMDHADTVTPARRLGKRTVATNRTLLSSSLPLRRTLTHAIVFSFNENVSPRNKKVGKSSVKKKAPAKGPSGRKRPDRTPPDTPVVLVPHDEIVPAPQEFSPQGRDALEAVNHLIRTGQTDQPHWELPTGDRSHYYGEDPAAIALGLPGTIGTAILYVAPLLSTRF